MQVKLNSDTCTSKPNNAYALYNICDSPSINDFIPRPKHLIIQELAQTKLGVKEQHLLN